MIAHDAAFAAVVVGALATVLTRDPRKAVFVFSFYGLLLSVLFLIVQAPDVALSELAVGSAAVPFIALVTLVRTRPKA